MKYINSLYSQLHEKVVTKEWVSEVFRFLKVIALGDNYFSIIFLAIFQPLITFLESLKATPGYQLGDHKIITKPFADDFKTITNNKKQHQIMMDPGEGQHHGAHLQAQQVPHPLHLW